METCGEYELERAIGWGRRATFFSARIAGAKGPAAVVIRRSRTVERALMHAFLRSAAEQQAAVGAGCRRLAPIIAFDCDAAGFAYYATARYETSLAEFLEAGCKVDSPLLRSIVTGVLGALTELHEKSRRAHGNLTPGNILLDPQGHIFLTDLAPSARDATTADDLFALGTLIYQLVRRTARIGLLNPPLDYSPPWTESLGDDAEGWREFTNRLLTKSRNTGPDALKVAGRDLKSLASLAAKPSATPRPATNSAEQTVVRRAPPKKRSPLPKLVAIVLLLAGAGGGYVLWKKHEDEKHRQEEIARKKREQEERDKALPVALQNFRNDLEKLPAELASDPALVTQLRAIGKSLDGAWNIDEIRSQLDAWELPGKMKNQAAAWRTEPREWTRLATLIETATQLDVKGQTSIIKQLQKTIAAAGDAKKLEDLWGEIATALKDLKATNNRLLPDFTPWAANEIRFATDLVAGADRAQTALEKLREVLSFQRQVGPRVLWTRFETEAAAVVQIPSSELMQGWPAKWKQEAERLVGPKDEKIVEWKGKLEAAAKRIAKLKVDQARWQKTHADISDAVGKALEADTATIDKSIEVFKLLRLAIEDEHERYVMFLEKWKPKAADATKETAQSVIDEFKAVTGKLIPEYQAKIGNKALTQVVKDMNAALKLQGKLSLDFASAARDWEAGASGSDVARYRYRKTIEVPFLIIDENYAMAAIETPLALAKLAMGSGSSPGSGPTIRTADFSVDAGPNKWLWKGPLDFTRSKGVDYFAAGVEPGDLQNNNCPVTWLSFKDADEMAKKLGGQLPTKDQWLSAEKNAGPRPRLRGTAWEKQVDRVTKWQTAFGTPINTRDYLPDYGSFSKRTGLAGATSAYVRDTAAAARKDTIANDESIWLKAAIPRDGWQPGDRFYHLIGNAAEWVSGALGPDGKPIPAVIGGSIVSPPNESLPTNKALPIAGGAGYFDVTFRLVVKRDPIADSVGLDEFKKVAGSIQPPPDPKEQ